MPGLRLSLMFPAVCSCWLWLICKWASPVILTLEKHSTQGMLCILIPNRTCNELGNFFVSHSSQPVKQQGTYSFTASYLRPLTKAPMLEASRSFRFRKGHDSLCGCPPLPATEGAHYMGSNELHKVYSPHTATPCREWSFYGTWCPSLRV